jgi:dihydroorotase
VIKLSTGNAAAAINRRDLGTLKVGGVGEATVIEEVSGSFDYADSIGERMMGTKRLLSAWRGAGGPLVASGVRALP